MTAPIGATAPAITTSTHSKPPHGPNPAQQARAADPTAKGAAFGALVSQFAKAKHAPPPPPAPPPAPVVAPVDTSAVSEPPVAPAVDITV
ncbi:MAG TPA: hypothetical protein VFW47_10285 [Phenylobacterium sp.]|nr:hypothetical protein [Phenylobacterium sp.]